MSVEIFFIYWYAFFSICSKLSAEKRLKYFQRKSLKLLFQKFRTI